MGNSMIPPEYSAFEKVVTVGCANFAPVWGDKKRTLAKIEANVVEAATQGIDIIAFPEESLTGTSRCDACRAEGHACDEHLEEAETVPGPATDHVVDLAREHDVYVLFGLPERDAHEPGPCSAPSGNTTMSAPCDAASTTLAFIFTSVAAVSPQIGVKFTHATVTTDSAMLPPSPAVTVAVVSPTLGQRCD